MYKTTKHSNPPFQSTTLSLNFHNLVELRHCFVHLVYSIIFFGYSHDDQGSWYGPPNHIQDL